MLVFFIIDVLADFWHNFRAEAICSRLLFPI